MVSPATTTFDVYDEEALALAEKYESRLFEEIHGSVSRWLPAAPAKVVDIGAGSGRDVAWFAEQGYQVTAVEPARRMREIARSLHAQDDIIWLDDCLPELPGLLRLDNRYDLAWLSAVWIHVPPVSRRLAFQNLVSLLAPAGRIMLSLREGPFPANRIMYATPLEEVEALARDHGLDILHSVYTNDQLDRGEVSWRSLLLGSAV